MGTPVTAEFLGEKWTLYTSGMSVYHSRNGKGTDCYKWCSISGRELVIRSDHVLEVDAARLGTFNYGNWWFTHALYDIWPYYYNGRKNVLDIHEDVNSIYQSIYFK